MARTTKTIVQTTITDDLDGKPLNEADAREVRFSLNGKAYKMDLSHTNADKLTKALQPFIDKAQKESSARPGKTTSGNRAPRTSPQQIRDVILSMKGEFRAADVPIGSDQTVKAAVAALEAEGKIVFTKEARAEGQRGRPSRWYKVK
jgi:hypothetical protein